MSEEGEHRIESFGPGVRYENGNRLIGLLHAVRQWQLHLHKETTRWTWESSNGTTHLKIDHILTNRRSPPAPSKSAIQPKAGDKDLTVLEEEKSSYMTAPDHLRLAHCLDASNKELGTNSESHQESAREQESTDAGSDCITSRRVVASTSC
ncbi:unnamed protein product [Strongylus vulgaris]|uniref:Uncharacterized protein n=1 Tax=Strongylus vulgaris TaxID=40348 RepID=A0A3P7KGM2_STRVU|nr:unnamed protein product [Strongylus vulgaris]